MEDRLRQRMARKLPTWAQTDGIQPPTLLALEQCSSETTARMKASLVNGGRLVDLTGGYGVDCYFMSLGFEHTDYVEQQSELAETARHNFKLLGASIQVHNTDAETFLSTIGQVDCLYIDPARRNLHGKKVVSLTECTPDVVRLHDVLLQHCGTLLLKLSTAHDIDEAQRLFPETKAVYVVGVQGECKELLLLVSAGLPEGGEPVIHCWDGRELMDFRPSDERNATVRYTEPEAYLYEPDATLLKAGAFKYTAIRYGLGKLHPNSHLYTSSTLVDGFPGRTFAVRQCLKTHDKQLKALGRANLTVRNFPASVADLRKKWKLAEGGPLYLFATTLPDGSHRILVCEKAGTEPPHPECGS